MSLAELHTKLLEAMVTLTPESLQNIYLFHPDGSPVAKIAVEKLSNGETLVTFEEV